jgi:hypothetical protein
VKGTAESFVFADGCQTEEIMDSNEIDTYLRALDAELAQRPIRKPVRIVVVGGVYMLFFLGNRAATKDVDIIPLDFPDTTNPNRETKVFRSAVNAIAKTFRLRRDWMNDVVAAFTPPIPAESLVLWRDSANLQVYVPPAECMLALKLLAGRARDEEDIAALCAQLAIHTREQAQALVDRYAERRWQQECMLQATLDALF